MAANDQNSQRPLSPQQRQISDIAPCSLAQDVHHAQLFREANKPGLKVPQRNVEQMTSVLGES